MDMEFKSLLVVEAGFNPGSMTLELEIFTAMLCYFFKNGT